MSNVFPTNDQFWDWLANLFDPIFSWSWHHMTILFVYGILAIWLIPHLIRLGRSIQRWIVWRFKWYLSGYQIRRRGKND